MSVLKHIEAMSGQLAESEAKVAQTVLADPRPLEHYTITRVAQLADTSTSAVLRFCHSLGYAGYKEFRYALVAELRQETPQDVDPLRALTEDFSGAIARLADLDRTTLGLLASQITQARTVFCIGVHRSFLPAEKLRMDLEDLGIVALSCRDSVQATHLANLVDEHSCTVIFSETAQQPALRAALDAGLAETGHSWLVTPSPRGSLAARVERTIALPLVRHASITGGDQHPVAMAFVELLTLLVKDAQENGTAPAES